MALLSWTPTRSILGVDLKKRPQAKFHKQLKPWKIEPADNSWLKITCPNCKGVAYVKQGPWLHGILHAFIGRSCTHCSKTARIPGSDE
jgi:hypothetical protein